MLGSQAKIKNVVLGSLAAFFVQSLISILLGQVLSLLPRSVTEIGSGALFLYFAYSFWKQSRLQVDTQASNNLSFRAVFSLIFMAEVGDVSQLAIATTAARSSSKMTVFIAAVAALSFITAIALFAGRNLKLIMNPNLIQKIASIAFLGFGLFLILHSIAFEL
jgi:putative Ca2+/H+ antiporter (TMEM165/GDT1 family)